MVRSICLGLIALLVAGLVAATALPGLFPQPAHAAQQCPPGTVLAARPYLGPGGAMQQNVGCYPPPAPPRPPFRYSYAALSYDSTTKTWSSAVGARSNDEARSYATSACRDGGGQNCKVMMGFSNQCVAVARAMDGNTPVPGKDSVNTGASKVDAEANAAKSCRADWNAGLCTIVLSECSLHGRRR